MQIRYQIKYQALLLFVVLTSSILLAACSSQQLIPDDGQDIRTVYNQHVGGTNEVNKMFRQLRSDRRDLKGYTRDASNEINQDFPKLPNPELSMYVMPHFSTKGHPVPGYSTAFSMYESDQYALPGELVQ